MHKMNENSSQTIKELSEDKEIKKSKVLKIIMILDSSLKSQLKIKKPHITVLGLNPHAGESGHLGTEEIKYIQPAIKEAKKKGVNVNGPLAADTAFNKEILKGVKNAGSIFIRTASSPISFTPPGANARKIAAGVISEINFTIKMKGNNDIIKVITTETE